MMLGMCESLSGRKRSYLETGSHRAIQESGSSLCKNPLLRTHSRDQHFLLRAGPPETEGFPTRPCLFQYCPLEPYPDLSKWIFPLHSCFARFECCSCDARLITLTSQFLCLGRRKHIDALSLATDQRVWLCGPLPRQARAVVLFAPRKDRKLIWCCPSCSKVP